MADLPPPTARPAARSRYLPWLLALPVFVPLAGLMGQLAVLIWVEGQLQQAAQVAAHEATLPQATLQSVAQVAHWRLARRAFAARLDPPTVTRNGHATGEFLNAQAGDQITVRLSVDPQAALPWPLRFWTFPLLHNKLQAHGTRVL